MTRQSLITLSAGIAIGAAAVTLISKLPSDRYPSQTEAQLACENWRRTQPLYALQQCNQDPGSSQILGQRLQCWPDQRLDIATIVEEAGEDQFGGQHIRWKPPLTQAPAGCSDRRPGPVKKRFRY